MCGIAGVICPDGHAAVEAVHRMNRAQLHRGPDDVGVHSVRVGAHHLTLGHRRLSIQDVSAAGHQPMVHPVTGDVIVYNGELYNVKELRNELASLGTVFQSRCDTEVILHGFAQWGSGCVEHFSGMFAFAIWSPREKKLLLARDPLGIKPLYLAGTARTIVIASELRAILASGATQRRIDRQGLASLLAYGAVAAPRTMIEGVEILDPGTWTEISLGEKLERRTSTFWRFPTRVQIEHSPDAVGAELRAPLERAVSSHLISDVPVGIFLSGGVDSTAIAALAAKARDGDVDTFCVSLADDLMLDESRVAALTAIELHSRHHEVRVCEGEALKLARSWLASIDQPTVDGLNTFVISRAVRERGIVVALSGLGGDELFGGYSTFNDVPVLRQLARIGRFLPADARRRLAVGLTKHRGGQRARKAGDLAASNGNVTALSLLRRRLFSDQDMRAFGFDVDASSDSKFLPPEALREAFSPAGDEWAAVRALETNIYMKNMLLRDADVFGMAVGLEIRLPLLDKAVVDCALSFSRGNGIFMGGQTKPWLTAALGDRIPERIRSLPKRGFCLPQAQWMAGALREEFSDLVEGLARSGAVDPRAVRLTWSRFAADQTRESWSQGWLLATLGAWIGRLQDGRSELFEQSEHAS